MEGQYENTAKSFRYAQELGVDAVAKKMNMGKQVEYTTFSETICRMIHEIARQARELGIETTPGWQTIMKSSIGPSSMT